MGKECKNHGKRISGPKLRKLRKQRKHILKYVKNHVGKTVQKLEKLRSFCTLLLPVTKEPYSNLSVLMNIACNSKHRNLQSLEIFEYISFIELGVHR